MSSELKQPEESLKSDSEKQTVRPTQETSKDQAQLHTIESTFTWKGPGKYWIDPNWVELSLGTQCRVATDKETVRFYSNQMEEGFWEWEASPVKLLWDNNRLIPYDGHHRLEASAPLGELILAQVDAGDLTRAIALSCGSNKKPSLRRTPEDNRKTVAMLEDLRVQHGDQWLLDIINSELPEDKHFKQLSLRAMEAYTGISFRTIKDVKDKLKEEKGEIEKAPKISFSPTSEELEIIQGIMDVEGFEKPSDVFRWLLEQYQES